jgi:pimeloyl-ACP methyl ester carboxylesterase
VPGICAVPASLVRVLAATQQPASSVTFSQKSGVPAWKTIPSWAVFGSADHTIPPAELLAMARRANARITIIPGAPHLSLIADPGIVTRVIPQAVHATT